MMDLLLKEAIKAGSALLSSGAETYRVEETIVRISEAFGVDHADAFVLPTGLFVTIVKDGKSYSSNVRIKNRVNDLNKIEAINALARVASEEEMSVEEFGKRLDAILNAPKYPHWFVCLFAGIGAFGFALFFGGTLKDACCAFLIGASVKYVVDALDKLEISSFISNAMGGCYISLLAHLSMLLGLGSSADKIIIASIMLLVPGIAFTNAIRDSLAGDLVSGLARCVEAILVATSIALGAALSLALIRIMGGGF